MISTFVEIEPFLLLKIFKVLFFHFWKLLMKIVNIIILLWFYIYLDKKKIIISKSLVLLFQSSHQEVCVISRFSRVQLCATLWTVACQAPLSMGSSRQESWSGLPCPPLQGIFRTQGSHPQHLRYLLHHRWILYHWATQKAHQGELVWIHELHFQA